MAVGRSAECRRRCARHLGASAACALYCGESCAWNSTSSRHGRRLLEEDAACAAARPHVLPSPMLVRACTDPLTSRIAVSRCSAMLRHLTTPALS